MRFDGDIIITDPCYIFSSDKDGLNGINLGETFYDLYCNAHDQVINQHRIDVCKKEIEKHEESIKNAKNAGVISLFKDFIEMNKNEIEHLQKPENFVCSDMGKPVCNFLSEIGFTDCMAGNTIYGDWSCSVFDTDSKEKIGSFCADGGLYGVFLLEEVLKINPLFDYHINRTWTTAWIKDFHGDIDVVIKEEDDEKEVQIIGKGNINFITKQTGL